MSRRHLLLLAAAVTDRTFERREIDGKPIWVGKCIHCGTKLVVADDGRSLGEATLEHIWPETQGGTNAVDNLAVACARCNRQKGTRHDHTVGQGLDAVVATLRQRRMERWREPEEVGMAARLASVYPST
ncbi:MAG: HNH endonuclease [Deltaproteobacteria bacterium]|nr:HNH endonuclease [Deltaproteobacteria bacterium]